MLELSDKWAPFLTRQAETGMGYWVVSVHLLDGREFDGVVIDSGFITRVGRLTAVPFAEAEIADIVVTHDKHAAGLTS